MKRFNRTNELLADAAEKAGVAAQYLAGAAYPTERLRDAWIAVPLAPVSRRPDRNVHSRRPTSSRGTTSSPRSNQFAGVLTASTGAVASLPRHPTGAGRAARASTTRSRWSGTSRSTRPCSSAAARPPAVTRRRRRDRARRCRRRCFEQHERGGTHVLFLASSAARSASSVFHVKAAPRRRPRGRSLKVTPTSLENNRLTVRSTPTATSRPSTTRTRSTSCCARR